MMVALRFYFGEHKSEREKESEGTSEGKDTRRPLQHAPSHNAA